MVASCRIPPEMVQSANLAVVVQVRLNTTQGKAYVEAQAYMTFLVLGLLY